MCDLFSQGLPYTEIGEKLEKDHTTIIYHIKRCENYTLLCKKRKEALKLIKAKQRARLIKKKDKTARFCILCFKEIKNRGNSKFCSHYCSNRHIYKYKTYNYWPKWIKDEQGNKVSTGKPYKEYLNEDKR